MSEVPKGMVECDKCKKFFAQSVIELSHDIPRYIGGQDIDGRHYLCHSCHQLYELEVLKQITMTLLSNQDETTKQKLRFKAKIVQGWWFKDE